MTVCWFNLRRIFWLMCGALLGLTIAACSPKAPEFRGTDLSDTGIGDSLAMPDTSGQLRTLEDFKGRVTVVFFGFTQCPDICPTALAELAHTMELLGEQAEHVQVVLISVDPERDTPEILSAYVAAFDPSFMALRGSDEQLQATAQAFKAYYGKVPGDTPGSYTMDHSASFYVFDKKAQARVLISGDTAAEDIAHDIRELL